MIYSVFLSLAFRVENKRQANQQQSNQNNSFWRLSRKHRDIFISLILKLIVSLLVTDISN